MKPADVFAIISTPFVQIALPIMMTLTVAAWQNGKRLDDMNKQIDEVVKRLDRIENTLSDFAQRIFRLEERTSPLAR